MITSNIGVTITRAFSTSTEYDRRLTDRCDGIGIGHRLARGALVVDTVGLKGRATVNSHVIWVGHLLAVNIERSTLRSRDGNYRSCRHRTTATAEDRSIRSGQSHALIGCLSSCRHAITCRSRINSHIISHLIDCSGKATIIGRPVGAVSAPLESTGRSVSNRTADCRAREG